ncbi:sigma-70 family RNA polymerase sigma factor [Sulfoacidibacillus ferrooxidans]|uniref:sigma-70 family RNA polymerase sigma factor n=1 Tax=Sulfoacidibacillus ferrooxidans TaxID=2005001 RepID=UPI001F510440
MASSFFPIYVVLRDGTTPNEQEFNQFLYHIRLEVSQKYRGYTGSWLSNDNYLHEDLFQQALAEISSGIHKGNFNPEMSTFKNWVDGLVHNTIRKHFARQKNQQNEQSLEQLVEDGGQWVDDMESTPEELLLKNHDVTIVRKAMKILYRKHLKYFQVLYCRAFHELSTSETAKLLGTTTHDISRTLNRAKEKLREIILEIETPVPNRK